MKFALRCLAAVALIAALAVLSLGHAALALVWFALSVLCLATNAPGVFGANVLGTLQGELILRRALELAFTKRPLLKSISMNFRDVDTGAVVANFNQVV